MTRDQREIHRKKRALEYAERVGNINKICRYFGISSLKEMPSVLLQSIVLQRVIAGARR